jgi:hypothetical protein
MLQCLFTIIYNFAGSTMPGTKMTLHLYKKNYVMNPVSVILHLFQGNHYKTQHFYCFSIVIGIEDIRMSRSNIMLLQRANKA